MSLSPFPQNYERFTVFGWSVLFNSLACVHAVSCAGFCGSNLACSCDEECIYYEYCCEDFITHCPNMYVVFYKSSFTEKGKFDLVM